MAFHNKIVLFDVSDSINENEKNKNIDISKKSNKITFKKNCILCHKSIRDCGLYSLNHELIFCDLVCAKIYFDNINKIEIDYNEYRKNYCNHKLSNKSLDIYKKYMNKFFIELPIIKISNFDKLDKLDESEYKKEIMKYKKMYL